MRRLSGRCGEAVWRVWEGYLEGVVRLSGGCGEAFWRVWGGCLESVGRLLGGYLLGCGEAVGCERLSGRYGEAL